MSEIEKPGATDAAPDDATKNDQTNPTEQKELIDGLALPVILAIKHSPEVREAILALLQTQPGFAGIVASQAANEAPVADEEFIAKLLASPAMQQAIVAACTGKEASKETVLWLYQHDSVFRSRAIGHLRLDADFNAVLNEMIAAQVAAQQQPAAKKRFSLDRETSPVAVLVGAIVGVAVLLAVSLVYVIGNSFSSASFVAAGCSIFLGGLAGAAFGASYQDQTLTEIEGDPNDNVL